MLKNPARIIPKLLKENSSNAPVPGQQPRRAMKMASLPMLILVLALALASCSSGQATKTAASVGVVTSNTITDKIETSGNLSANQLVQLTWGTSGLVGKINVTVGQKVKTGDVLAELQADSVPANIVTARADLASAQRDLADLQNSSLSAAEAQQAVLAAKKKVEEAQNNLDALDYPRASDTLIKNTQAQIWDAQKNVTLAAKKYKEVEHHLDGDPEKTAGLLALTNAQMALNDLVATYNWYIAKPTQADYDDARAALDVAKANLEDAKRKRDNIKNGADPLTIAAAQAKVAAAQATVNSMLTIAPFDGEIIAIQAAVGNSVSKDDASVALVDRNSLKVDTQIDESSIASIAVGNSAEVTMDSLAGQTLKGKVSMLDPIGTTVNGLVKYTVTVSLEPTNLPLLFGATANVVIITGQPQAMLSVPANAVQADAKGEYVNRVNADGTTERISVTSGTISGNSVALTSSGSLKEGDKVQVSTGTTSSSNNNSSSGSNSNQGGGIPIPGAGGPPGG